jgi:curved DNA-binding protein CbpA
MPFVDHYQALGLKKGATEGQIKNAYKAIAVVDHPDKLPKDLTQKQRDEATARFKAAAAAKDLLTSKLDRFDYDKTYDADLLRAQYEAMKITPPGTNKGKSKHDGDDGSYFSRQRTRNDPKKSEQKSQKPKQAKQEQQQGRERGKKKQNRYSDSEQDSDSNSGSDLESNVDDINIDESYSTSRPFGTFDSAMYGASNLTGGPMLMANPPSPEPYSHTFTNHFDAHGARFSSGLLRSAFMYPSGAPTGPVCDGPRRERGVGTRNPASGTDRRRNGRDPRASSHERINSRFYPRRGRGSGNSQAGSQRSSDLPHRSKDPRSTNEQPNPERSESCESKQQSSSTESPEYRFLKKAQDTLDGASYEAQALLYHNRALLKARPLDSVARDICQQVREQIDAMEEAMKKYERASIRYLNAEKDAVKRAEVSDEVYKGLERTKGQVEDAMKKVRAAEEELRKKM